LRQDNWVTIPGGRFQMGRYPVTVEEYRRFVEAGGYQEEQFWPAGSFGQWTEPRGWDEQLQHPNRPVVNVSWYDAAAYCAWAGCSSPADGLDRKPP
jgi:formylglycine-generating enzyme required for sulfatase activity